MSYVPNRADVRKRFTLSAAELARVSRGSVSLSVVPLDRVLNKGDRYGALTVAKMNAGGLLVLATLPNGSERWLLREQYDQLAQKQPSTKPKPTAPAVIAPRKSVAAAAPKTRAQLERLTRLERHVARLHADEGIPMNKKKRAASLLRQAVSLLEEGDYANANDDKVDRLLEEAAAELASDDGEDDTGSAPKYSDARAKQRQRMGLAASSAPAIKIEETKFTFSVHALAQQQGQRTRA
jgi:hypothetical protein